MKPIEFKGQNTIAAKDQPQYKSLPLYKATTIQGECISCWKLSFSERIRLLFTGKIWISMMTFNKPIMPIYPTTKKTDVLIINSKNNL